MIRIEIDHDLVEECVHAAVAARGTAAAFHRERERCYEARGDEREAAFRRLFTKWSELLGVDRPLVEALEERPSIARQVALVRVCAAKQRQEQGVELFVDAAGADVGREQRRLHARIVPTELADHDAALGILRPELLHVADMLDPGFCYEPRLPPAQAGPTHDRMLLDRYAALWSASVVGRLRREARATLEDEKRATLRLMRAFPMHAARVTDVFGTLLAGARPPHEELVRIALDPRAALEGLDGLRSSPGAPQPGSRCSLCGFPTYSFEPPSALLPLAGAIRVQFAEWSDDDPVCPQCADIYRARVPSTAARTSVSAAPGR